MLTAREYLENHSLRGHIVMDSVDDEEIEKDMIEFAKLHVKAALIDASESNFYDWDSMGECCCEVDRGVILKSYPLENIK